MSQGWDAYPLWYNMIAGGETCIPIGTGLEEETVKTYRQEWDMYVRHCRSNGWRRVPGRDRRWRIAAVSSYLRWRAGSNNARSIAQIKSKLKHCGLCYDFLLPTAKGEGPSKLRLQLAMVSKAIAKAQGRQRRAAGLSTGPKRALALGRVAVSLLFSAYGATNEEAFAKLNRLTRHYLSMSVVMHTGGMRFRLILEVYRKCIIRWSQADKTYSVVSDWRKMKQPTGEYAVKFPVVPKFSAMVYDAYDANGSVVKTFTAARVLKWQTRITGSRKGKYVFEPEEGKEPSAKRFKEWLRASFSSLLGGNKSEVAALAKAITPHSFRAGMASDLERSNVPRATIQKHGRWSSVRAMEQYMRDGLAQKIGKVQFWHIQCRRRKVTRRRMELTRVEAVTDDSEGYDDDSME